ncbi:hypothetical protein CYMTET_13852 [Cymbomonas tetramitiformis]|uniref:2Fe-2S ferredoxin-type domain-containing protein n=1 Tax=Cymbomonas tetramitiformis TaxID=36881 RepID=A0AAE0LAZ6_9CHLO|nr:hypothetical protein CYMTET_13852 [Cymbomonas tetramitiformis]
MASTMSLRGTLNRLGQMHCSGKGQVLDCKKNRPACARSTRLLVSADLEFCRDKVNSPTYREVTEESKMCKVTVVGGEETQTIEIAEDEYILDGADRCGIDLPATCRGGICGACVGRIAEGKVDQSDIEDLDFVIDKEQQEQGFALLCMARPVGDVTIEAQCDWGNISMTEWKGATFYTGKPKSLFSEG